MSYLLVALAMTVIVTTFLWLHARRQATKHGTTTGQELTGICTAALDQSVRKKRNKARVMELFTEYDELSNSDIRKYMNVTSRSVRNYVSELEREGLIIQVGDTGRGVTYRRT